MNSDTATVIAPAANCPACGQRLMRFFAKYEGERTVNWRDIRNFFTTCGGCRRRIEYETLPPCSEYRVRLDRDGEVWQ